nr:pyridoxal phosphate-dependent aminotransferase family protein [Bacillus sp. DNRA2]
MNTAPSPKVEINGRKQLVFSSNNYLGLANNESCIYAAETILHQFGVGSSGTGATTGYTKWHHMLENKIAKFTNTEAAMLFLDGSLAIFGVMLSVLEKGDVILCDQLNHVCVNDAGRLSEAETITYLHVDMADLEEKLRHSQNKDRRFIVTKGVFSINGSIAPLDKIMSLAKNYSAYVIVDDSHAIGVIGEHGRGTSELFNVNPDVIIGSLNNAFGAVGGFVCGSRTLIDFLRNYAKTFVYHPSIPPALCGASYAAIEILENSREKRLLLKASANYVRNCLANMGYFVKGQHSPIISVIIGDPHQTEAFSARLEEEGIFALPAPQLAYKGIESLIRLTITSEHGYSDIEYLLNKFEVIGKDMGII